MHERVRRHLKASFIVMVLILIGANLALFSVRIDLTANRVFSVMPETRAVWEQLEDPVSIRYYLSGALRARTAETRHIEEYLDEYARQSQGLVELQVLNPDESRQRREEAEELGVVPQRVQLQRGPDESPARVYSGIVLEYRDRREVIPLAFDPNEIEFELTAAITALQRGARPELGVVIGDRAITVQDSLQLIANQLARRFRLRVVDLNEELPESLSGLLVIGNNDLGQAAVQRLEGFIASGRGAIIAVDRLRVEPELGAVVAAVEQPHLTEWLAGYGVVAYPALVLDPDNRSIPVERRVGETRVQDEDPYPFWPAIGPDSVAGDHPVGHGVSSFTALWPSRLELDPANEIETVVLARSSPESWVLAEIQDVSPGRHSEPPPGEPFSGSYPLAVALSVGAGSDNREPGGRLVAISGSRTVTDMMQVAAPRGTLELLDNAAHWIVGDEELARLRREAPTERRLDAIEHPAGRAFQGWVARTVNVALVPLGVILAGVWYRRRRVQRGRREAPSAGK